MSVKNKQIQLTTKYNTVTFITADQTTPFNLTAGNGFPYDSYTFFIHKDHNNIGIGAIPFLAPSGYFWRLNVDFRFDFNHQSHSCSGSDIVEFVVNGGTNGYSDFDKNYRSFPAATKNINIITGRFVDSGHFNNVGIPNTLNIRLATARYELDNFGLTASGSVYNKRVTTYFELICNQ